METIKLEYSEALVRRAIKSYWWKQTGILFLVTIVVLSAFWIYLWVSGDRSWLLGLLGAVVSLALVTIMATYFVHLNRALTRLRRMEKPEASLGLTENRMHIASDIGVAEFDWSAINQLWRFNGVWLLFFSAGEFMTMPAKDIPEKHKQFILGKLKENGALMHNNETQAD